VLVSATQPIEKEAFLLKDVPESEIPEGSFLEISIA
jgi:hypothetical protein